MTGIFSLQKLVKLINVLVIFEILFYQDQLSSRKFRLSEEIDEEHEQERLAEAQQRMDDIAAENEEHSFINDPSFDEIINSNAPRTHMVPKIIKCDKEVQVYTLQSDCPEIRKCKKTTEEVRNAIATVSYRSGISVPKA